MATTTRIDYGQRLAWIGMVLTRPDNRRQGLARLLMEDAIASAESDGVRTLKLDATEQGRPLYEDLGFVVEGVVERWERKGKADGGTASISACEITEELFEQDESAFGASRQMLLRELMQSGRCGVAPEGFVFSRAGRIARYLGPCVSACAKSARELIARHMNQFPAGCGWYWDLLRANAGAASCSEELGFERSRTLWRMRRGDAIENDDSLTYAIAGFEWG